MLAGLVLSGGAAAHSASDAYLDLDVEAGAQGRPVVIHGQWDIALRDLDFVLGLDQDGDGRLRWGEVRQRQADIENYAYAHLEVTAEHGQACALERRVLRIDDHADGAYAALFFDLRCPHPTRSVGIAYRLFFAVDPSHRGILVAHSADGVSTSVFSPSAARIDLPL